MTERLNVRLGNLISMFFWTFAMFLIGYIAGVYWHPSRAFALSTAVAAGVFTVLHELACCFVWCSLTAWWIGRRSNAPHLKR
jgi:hypothetical protein